MLAHAQHQINRRRDAAMPSPALQQQLSHSQRFVATRTPPSHHPIPCIPAAASRTPRLLKTSELDRPFAFLRPSPEIPPPFTPKSINPSSAPLHVVCKPTASPCCRHHRNRFPVILSGCAQASSPVHLDGVSRFLARQFAGNRGFRHPAFDCEQGACEPIVPWRQDEHAA